MIIKPGAFQAHGSTESSACAERPHLEVRQWGDEQHGRLPAPGQPHQWMRPHELEGWTGDALLRVDRSGGERGEEGRWRDEEGDGDGGVWS